MPKTLLLALIATAVTTCNKPTTGQGVAKSRETTPEVPILAQRLPGQGVDQSQTDESRSRG
jgi:hypothetical protein